MIPPLKTQGGSVVTPLTKQCRWTVNQTLICLFMKTSEPQNVFSGKVTTASAVSEIVTSSVYRKPISGMNPGPFEPPTLGEAG